MLAQAVRRLLLAIPTLLAIVASAFVLMHLAPGGPFTKERQMPPEIERRLLAEYNLDQPIHVQLGHYLAGLARGDLGPSMTYKDKDVVDIIAEGAPTSAILGLSAMILALFVGSALGVIAALRQNKAQDYLVMALAIAGVCLPPLVVGPIMQLLFGVQWGILPSQGLHRDEFGLIYLLLPVLTLSLPLVAIVSRLMRASMIEALRSNAIRTARAKGLPERSVIWRHALPIAMLPIVSYAGPALAGVMAGSFVIETVFALPGIGKQFVLAAQQRDYTLVMGVVLIYSFLIIMLNLAADLMYRVLDPPEPHGMSDILIDDAPQPQSVKGRSLWEDARRRLMRNPAAVTSLYVVAILVLIAIFGPFLWVHKYDTIFRDSVAIAPTFENMHLLGTDTEGRDMVARLIFGLGISLLVGLAATIVALGIGVTYGAVAGFVGGWLDEGMMRFVDVLYSIPFVFFVIVLMTVVQTDSPVTNLMLIFMAIGAVEWLTMSRIVRGQTIALRKKEFVEAARAAGAKPLEIVFRHIVPNVLGPVVVFATLNIPVIILAESFLSFIGLGVQEPLTSLGRLISDGARQMINAPWMLISPAVTMLITLLALNFLGDGLRDALDPKER